MMQNDLASWQEIEHIQNLFRAVLRLAAKDAYGVGACAKKRKALRKDALDFFQNKRYFKKVCMLAGIDERVLLNITENKKLTNKEKYNKIISNF